MITGRTFRITPVERYWICWSTPAVPTPGKGEPFTLVLCWVVTMGTSLPTWMEAVSPLRAITFGLDSTRAFESDASASMAARMSRAALV